MNEPQLLPFNEVRVRIPQKTILKYHNGIKPIPPQTTKHLCRLLAKLDQAKNQIAHTISLVEVVLNKVEDRRGLPLTLKKR